MDAELLRGLWPPSELSQRRLIFNAHHRGFCFVAFDAPLPDGDPFAVSWFGVRLLYFFFLLFSIKARIYQSLQEAGWVCVRSQKAPFKYPLFA